MSTPRVSACTSVPDGELLACGGYISATHRPGVQGECHRFARRCAPCAGRIWQRLRWAVERVDRVDHDAHIWVRWTDDFQVLSRQFRSCDAVVTGRGRTG